MKGSSYDGCQDEDCASTNLEDGCLACMCYNYGHDSLCDGTQSAYYDNYVEVHRENPFGDANGSNRKCNTNFSPKWFSCQQWNWECENGLECNNVCLPPDKGGGPCLNCDPMSPYDDKDVGCYDDDCASDVLKDGCLACICYINGNASWCDGTKSAYYDNYYKENRKNPFGDSNQDNRKCNTDFSQQDTSCRCDWQCENGRCVKDKCCNNFYSYVNTFYCVEH